jgi:hypothetical protein
MPITIIVAIIIFILVLLGGGYYLYTSMSASVTGTPANPSIIATPITSTGIAPVATPGTTPATTAAPATTPAPYLKYIGCYKDPGNLFPKNSGAGSKNYQDLITCAATGRTNNSRYIGTYNPQGAAKNSGEILCRYGISIDNKDGFTKYGAGTGCNTIVNSNGWNLGNGMNIDAIYQVLP